MYKLFHYYSLHVRSSSQNTRAVRKILAVRGILKIAPWWEMPAYVYWKSLLSSRTGMKNFIPCSLTPFKIAVVLRDFWPISCEPLHVSLLASVPRRLTHEPVPTHDPVCVKSASSPKKHSGLACDMRRRPSKPNGLVTTPTVKAPTSFATSATIGAAPDPVPPPIPAVTKTISAPATTCAKIMSKDKDNDFHCAEREQALIFSSSVFHFCIPFIVVSSPCSCSCSLLIVSTQIRGHIVGFSPPSPLRHVPCMFVEPMPSRLVGIRG